MDKVVDGFIIWALMSSPLLIAAVWAGIWEKIEKGKRK